MGRHRSDPRGLARISLITLAVAAVVGLLAFGGFSLHAALTSRGGTTPAAAESSPAPNPRASSDSTATVSALMVRCIAAQCSVFVSGPTPTDVQFNGTLSDGEEQVYDKVPLSVVIPDGSTVRVYIYGRQQPLGRPGQQLTYQVKAR